jgi:hypothetical protein
MHDSLSPHGPEVVTEASAFGQDFVAMEFRGRRACCLRQVYVSLTANEMMFDVADSDLPNADRISTLRRRLAKQVGLTMHHH